MSIAGIRSSRGDQYQCAIALYWAVRMLTEDDIVGIQVESLALPGESTEVLIDDIVILKQDGSREFIQAKVYQKNNRVWSLSDPVLKDELLKARDQLLQDSISDVAFYSCTPFGDFDGFLRDVRAYPDYAAFSSSLSKKNQAVITTLADIWSLPEEEVYRLSRRIKTGSHHSSEEWERYALSLLETGFSRAETALALIWKYIDQQHSKSDVVDHVIDRQAVMAMLNHHGIYHLMYFDEQALLQSFSQFSIAESWIRDVGSQKILRNEVKTLQGHIDNSVASVLLEDVAGGGKTCILLDLIDEIEQRPDIACLFIPGDKSARLRDQGKLSEMGLPDDLLAQCARLAEKRKVVVVLDSLDVLAVGRNHNALRFFLGLAKELAKIPNITVIAASRAVDARYEPHLRSAPWEKTVTVTPLDFDRDITPLLSCWKVNVEDIQQGLRKLLVVPQNLRLFYSLVQRGLPVANIGGHDLFDRYLQEVIEKDDDLGPDVVMALQNLSISLLKAREHQFSANVIALPNEQIERLKSHEVLITRAGGMLAFSHQTMADALRIRHAQQSGVSLADFVLSQPQLPFIRPAIRAFIQSLRIRQPGEFPRQFRSLLRREGISGHIKNLALQELAAMAPTDADLPIIRQMFRGHSALLMRFLDYADTKEWFELLHFQWFSGLAIHQNKRLFQRYLHYSSRFKNQYPETLVQLWLTAVEEGWINEHQMCWQLPSYLDDFEYLEMEDVGLLLEKLLERSGGERDGVGKAISLYVERTGQGDDMLWRYITSDYDPQEDTGYGRNLNIHCASHHFHSEIFLADRLKQSQICFGLAADFLLSLYDDRKPYFTLLDDVTSREQYLEEATHVLLNGFKQALVFHAENNDECWVLYEPQLASSHDAGIQYLLCQAYQASLSANMDGVGRLLTAPKLLEHWELRNALGLLANKVYPCLEADVQHAHQQQIMSLYDDREEQLDWLDEAKFQLLSWVPAPYLLPELQDFYQRGENKCPDRARNLEDWSIRDSAAGKTIGQAVSKLSNRGLTRLMSHYDGHHDHFDHDGNQESVARSLNVAAKNNPDRYLPLLHQIERYRLSGAYIIAILEGVSSHIHIRFGNLSDDGWSPVEPLPDGVQLAQALLAAIERYAHLDEKGYDLLRMIEACGAVLQDQNAVERMIFQLWRLSTFTGKEDEVTAEDKFINVGLNTVRGRLTSCAITIANKLLEDDQSLPSDLCCLLERLSRDSSPAVRAVMFRHLPYVLGQKQDLGWKLIALATRDWQDDLGADLERCLYYNYHNHFDKVAPYLEHMKFSQHKETCEAWGRITALSVLAGHVPEDELFAQITSTSPEGHFNGVMQAFIANMPEHKSVCLRGLKHTMNTDAPGFVYRGFERGLSKEDVRKVVPSVLIQLFLEKVVVEHSREIDGVFPWMLDYVNVDPEEVLILLEQLIEKVSAVEESFPFYHQAEDLIATLKLLLEEADCQDDDSFTDRVLAVQNWFIDAGVRDVEELLEGY